MSPRRKTEPMPDDLRALLEHLRRSRGFDFTGYKRPTLERRLQLRMGAVGVGTYPDYQDYLEVHPDEFVDLFNTILINVTGFLRDKQAWEYLAAEILPQLLDAVPDPQPIRVWSAACSSGEEAYSAAIVLAEALGEDDFRRRVKIYATDVDDEALSTARSGVYPADALKPLGPELRDRYFQQGALGYTFRADLRRSVIFGRNDLVQDAPISRVHLLVSRNALMYFTPETQAEILRRFNFSLAETGYLFLGKSEMLITHTDLFTPVNLKWRLFRKVVRPGLRERLMFMNGGDGEHGERNARLSERASDVSPLAQVVVTEDGALSMANQRARNLFALAPADVGRPLQDLELSYRPVELRSLIERANQEGRAIEGGRAPWRSGGEELVLHVRVTPVGDATGAVSITFEDVTVLARIEEEFQRSKRQLGDAHEELQTTIEELETTNEELQSTNEELETTNEELQSTNEELETMNEELQSTNDELEAVNEDQRERSRELDRLNIFLEGILGNLGMGVAVLDRDRRVQLWNKTATEYWGVRAEEVEGEHLLDLDIGLPLERLGDPLRRALAKDAESSEFTIEAVNRRGRPIACLVRVLPLLTRAGENYGAVVLMRSGPDDGSAPAPAPAAPSNRA